MPSTQGYVMLSVGVSSALLRVLALGLFTLSVPGVAQAACDPECEDRDCGPDGCGGLCGLCSAGELCEPIGWTCVPACQPFCPEGNECGPDGCGQTCGSCGPGQVCVDALCEGECVPDCNERLCGDDLCGGSCGECPESWQECVEGLCQGSCVSDCDERQCGDDGCGGSCGDCDLDGVCVNGQCCQPDCAQRECGADGCGGLCGECAPGSECVGAFCVASELPCDTDADCSEEQTCRDGVCADETCRPACEGRMCGPDGCGGACGSCEPGLACVPEVWLCQSAGDRGAGAASGPSGAQMCEGNTVWDTLAQRCVGVAPPETLMEEEPAGCKTARSSTRGWGLLLLCFIALGIGRRSTGVA